MDTQQAQRRFTLDELEEHNGKDGQPAYVAYEGKVYDVTGSKLWRNGVHVRAHHAGEDLSSNMVAAPHGDDVMERFEVVGTVAQDDDEDSGQPWWVALSLDNHLHPIAVHFPTALGAVAPVFALGGLALSGVWPQLNTALQHAALWCLVVCFLSTIPSVATGWISWAYNYSGIWTRIYRVKWIGSGVLFVLSAATLALKLFALGGIAVVDYSQPLSWVYLLLLAAVAANVAVLGHFGGKITFPS